MSDHRSIADLGSLIRQLSGRVASLELNQGARVRGTVTLTWPGGSPESNVTAVPAYVLGSAPTVSITPTSRVGAVAIDAWTDTPTSTGFNIRGRTLDGSSPAGAATATVDWIAVL